MTRAAALVALLVVAMLLGVTDGAAVRTQYATLFGKVGTDFTISLVDAQGAPV